MTAGTTLGEHRAAAGDQARVVVVRRGVPHAEAIGGVAAEDGGDGQQHDHPAGTGGHGSGRERVRGRRRRYSTRK